MTLVNIKINFFSEAPQVYSRIKTYVPPDRTHFNYWTMYPEKDGKCFFVNSDDVSSIEVKEVKQNNDTGL